MVFETKRYHESEDADGLNSLHVLSCEQIPLIKLSPLAPIHMANCHTKSQHVKLILSSTRPLSFT